MCKIAVEFLVNTRFKTFKLHPSPPAVMLCLHSSSSSSSPPPPPASLRLLCSSNLCPRPVLLHAECYDKLENLLVQAVFSSKNFKNWTEYQVLRSCKSLSWLI